MSTRLQWCSDFLKQFLKENNQKTGPFLSPVDLKTYTDYSELIRRPMDFSTVKRQLDNNQYVAYEEFAADMRLVFTNCFRYNPPKHPIVEVAKELKADFELRYAKKLNGLAVTNQHEEISQRCRLLERATKFAAQFSAAKVQHGAAPLSSVAPAGPADSPSFAADAKNARKRTRDGKLEALKRDVEALQEVVFTLRGFQGSTISNVSSVLPDVSRVSKRPLGASKDADKRRGSKRVRGDNAYAAVVMDDATPTSTNDGISSTTHTPTKDVANNNAFLSNSDADVAECDEVIAVDHPAALPPSPARSSSLSHRDDTDNEPVVKADSPPADVSDNVAIAPAAPVKLEQKSVSLAEEKSAPQAVPVITTKSPATSAIPVATSTTANPVKENAEDASTQQQSPRKTGALDRLADTLKQKQKDSLTAGSTTNNHPTGLARLASTGGGLANVDWNKLPAMGVRAHIFNEHMEDARHRMRQEAEAREEENRRRLQQQQPKPQQQNAGAQPTGKHLSPGWSHLQLPAAGHHQHAAAGSYGKSSLPAGSTYTPTNVMPPAAAVMSPPGSDSSAASSTVAGMSTSQSERLKQRELEREMRAEKKRRAQMLDPQQSALDGFLQDMRSEGIRGGF